MSSNMTQAGNKVHYSLFKGEPGTWKSSAAVTYPGPQYWFSFDGKMNALHIPMLKHGIDPNSIEFDDFDSWTEAKKVLEPMTYGVPGGLKYKTIVLDSVTSCADYMLREVILNKTGATKKSGADAGKRVGGFAVNEMEDFNAESAGLTELIALTKKVHKFHKIDVILIAHVIRTDQKDQSGKVQVARQLVTAGKKPAAKIPAYCDETYHFGLRTSIDPTAGGEFVILTQNNGDDFARTSLPLNREIKINDVNFYKDVVLPAITQQEQSIINRQTK